MKRDQLLERPRFQRRGKRHTYTPLGPYSQRYIRALVKGDFWDELRKGYCCGHCGLSKAAKVHR